MVKDEGKYYFVLKAVKGHDDIEERELYKIYGHILFEHKDKVFYEYLINEKKKRENITIMILCSGLSGITLSVPINFCAS